MPPRSKEINMKKMYRAGSDAVVGVLEPVVDLGKSLAIGAEMGRRVMTDECFHQELASEGVMRKSLDKCKLSPERIAYYERKYHIAS
jgi:hypothetical protein